eukprot:5566943-Amphidinium_carterae.1
MATETLLLTWWSMVRRPIHVRSDEPSDTERLLLGRYTSRIGLEVMHDGTTLASNARGERNKPRRMDATNYGRELTERAFCVSSQLNTAMPLTKAAYNGHCEMV